MSFSALVIGYGSIGKRHAEILNTMDRNNCVYVLSSQTGLPYETIKDLEEIPILNPDYVVIASNTASHYEQLIFLEKDLRNKKILVEKPLFDSFHELEIKYNQVNVGYNLRFHPMIQKIRNSISGRRLWNIQVFCGSYLPDWRPERDYRETSSAKLESGGGVLLDMSHELDYIQWLVGPIEVTHAVSKKVSDLEIDSDDLLLLSGKTKEGTHLHISLNYFTRESQRQILIDGEDISIRADLETNTLSMVQKGEASDYSWPVLKRNETYLAQHRAILEDDRSFVCTYNEGLEVMRLVENIHYFGNS